MNIELLTKLANKAMSEPPYDGSADRWGMFAELIVREAARLILEETMGDLGDSPDVVAWREGYNEAVHDCHYRIKKEFGLV